MPVAAVRHPWIFRTAAVVHLFFGLAAIWRFGPGSLESGHWLPGVGLGILSVIVGASLFRPARFAIALSAIGCAIVAVSAAVAAPIMRGPVILAFAAVAAVVGLYAALAARELFDQRA